MSTCYNDIENYDPRACLLAFLSFFLSFFLSLCLSVFLSRFLSRFLSLFPPPSSPPSPLLFLPLFLSFGDPVTGGSQHRGNLRGNSDPSKCEQRCRGTVMRASCDTRGLCLPGPLSPKMRVMMRARVHTRELRYTRTAIAQPPSP